MGRGSRRPRVAFVVEAPGYRADRSGVALDGPAGAILAEALAAAGIPEEDVLITHLVRCRPPEARPPASDEVAACEPHLFAELVAAHPEIVCPMGSAATAFLTGRSGPISRRRGEVAEIRLAGRSVPCLPLVDPSAAAAVPIVAGALLADVARIPALLSGEGVAAPPASMPPAAESIPSCAPSGAPEAQLALFAE